MDTDISDLDSAIAQVQAAQQAQATRVQAQIDKLNATIAQLQQNPAAQDYTSEIQSLQEISAALDEELPDPTDGVASA